MDLATQHDAELERLTYRRLPASMGLLLTFLLAALPVELYNYPGHLRAYLLVYAVECVLSAVCLLAAVRWQGRARLIATVWASLLGLCVSAYYPIVGNDATIAMAALICLVSAIPATLPLGPWYQLGFGSVCAFGFFATMATGVPVSLPWPYIFVAFLAVLTVTTTGAHSLMAFRWDVFQREASLHATQEHLRTALARAESAVALRSRLVANVSHELRTPVNVIIGYADMLLDPTLAPSEVADLAGRVRGYGVTLESLVSGLLDLSRLSCGKVEIALAEIDLPALLGEVAEGARLLVKHKPVRVVVDCPRIVFTSDPVRVRQILDNLAANAAKFTAEGTITLRAQAGQDWATFTVHDTGCGVPADKHEVIFTAFEQLGPGSALGGIGLGLAIVRQLTELLGGTVKLDSVPGAGARFAVTLPGVVREAGAGPAASDEAA